VLEIQGSAPSDNDTLGARALWYATAVFISGANQKNDTTVVELLNFDPIILPMSAIEIKAGQKFEPHFVQQTLYPADMKAFSVSLW
jgi:hypothetical protein